jgi:hypothetical protein
METFLPSRRAKQVALTLLGAAVTLWIYAALTLRWYLANMELSRAVPAIFLAMVVVAAPPLWWTLLCECFGRIEVGEAGLRLRAPGLELAFPWGLVQGLKEGSVADTLELKVSVLPLIRNPVARLLYWQAYGSRGVPLWKGLEGRDRLMEIVGKYVDAGKRKEG